MIFFVVCLLALSCHCTAAPVESPAALPSAAETTAEIAQLKMQVHELTEHLANAGLGVRARRQSSRVLNENQVPKRSCKEILDDGTSVSGLYKTAPTDNKGEFTVYCDMTSQGGGWTVIQRRNDDTTDFYRDWQAYKTGFGDLDGNFWLGLEKIHRITQIESHELLVTITDHDNKVFHSIYTLFKVDSAMTKYQLDIGDISTTVKSAGDSLSIHDNQKFSTYDNDNDISPDNCARDKHGAWWYKKCHESNLNGRYYYGNYQGLSTEEDGVVWYSKRRYWYSFKKTVMAIRPIN